MAQNTPSTSAGATTGATSRFASTPTTEIDPLINTITGIVTICMLTFCRRSTVGTSSFRPGASSCGRTRPNR